MDELDYGEGKTREQEARDSMWVVAYGFAGFLVVAVAAIAFAVVNHYG
jgi:hypothetical protein